MKRRLQIRDCNKRPVHHRSRSNKWASVFKLPKSSDRSGENSSNKLEAGSKQSVNWSQKSKSMSMEDKRAQVNGIVIIITTRAAEKKKLEANLWDHKFVFFHFISVNNQQQVVVYVVLLSNGIRTPVCLRASEWMSQFCFLGDEGVCLLLLLPQVEVRN